MFNYLFSEKNIKQENDIENPENNNNDDDNDKLLCILDKIKEDISRNSLEIADLKENEENKQENEENNLTENVSIEGTINKNIPRYVYANLFDEEIKDFLSSDEKEQWSELKRYRFQKCLWKLKYNRIISLFYLDTLRRREQRWSWMIIVISTITSGLTIANNVDKEPINHYNTGVNILLTVSSMTTSLIAAWIKKQMFIEKINEIDKYLININSLCEDLDIQLSLLNSDRTSYIDFKKKYIPEITKFLTTNPIIPPIEWKNCIREITVNFPEILNLDNSEDNKLWPWYGDLIFHEDDDKIHTRYPTHFMKYFKRTNKDKLKSSCCGGNKFKSRYNY